VYTVAVDGTPDRTPEHWARGLIEHAAASGGQIVWRTMGMRLGSSPDHIGGWKVDGRGDDWIRLETASWYVTANAVLTIVDGTVSAAVFLRYDRPIARIVCPPIMFGHRRAMPALLRRAARFR
jgi:hypothetical protein